ncbi:MAG: maleylpyruvate isomerase family mycothiol-dependent enzyme [Nocardiopsaceae bacterium]|jgi:uncharacterized protein (TIGR03083 family)|nr:maleylpyruvate isomerase family mycothiol-dependent enzyme [Nocardiopsaceae bacterium]
MTTMPTTEPDLMRAIAAERQDLADLLSGLPEDGWNAATLCAGWRVRELVAHQTMPFRYGSGKFLTEMIRSGGRFHVMADRCARRDAARIPAPELLAALRDNVTHPWKPPGGGHVGALTHDVVHGLDFAVPLGMARRVPEERLRIVLAAVTDAKARKHFGTDLDGVELRADDLDWSIGSGEQLSGAAQDLLLVICGRKLPPGRLTGAPAQCFTSA